MNSQKYAQSLKGVTRKDDVISALDSVVQDLGTKVIPIVDTTAAAFKTIKLKSPEVIGYEERYRSEFRLGRGDNIFVDLQERLATVSKNLTSLRTLIEKHLPETVSAGNIDHRSAVLMQLVDNASFTMRFVRRFVETSVIYETEVTGIYPDYAKNNLTKGEVQWVNARFPFFISMIEALSMAPHDFTKKFEDIPSVKVDTESGNDVSMFGRDKMDPFKLGFIPLSINPFFIVGRWIAEWQAWRYKEAQEDLSRIQKRIMLLEEAEAGKANPKIEKEIEILRDKSEGLIYKINKAEEDIK